MGGLSRFPARTASRTLLLFSAGLGSRLTLGRLPPQGKNPVGRLPPTTSLFPWKLPSTQVRSRPPACHPFRGSSHPGKQLSAIFAGRLGGRLNTDHDFDTDRVGPSSGQPGNITPRGPSPPRTRNLFRFLVRTRTTRCQTSEGTRWGPVAPCVEPAWSLRAVPVHRPLWRQLHQRQLLPLLQQL